jgi:uncharacterized protein YndB with AHSA1/START domain
MRQLPVVAVLTVSSLVWPTEGRSVERILRKEMTVRAPLEAVWEAWTSEEGLAAVSPRSVVELRPGGRYEWFLDGEPDPRGVRGSAGSHFVAVLPRELIAFRWTFPPSLPRLRESGATGQVIVRFSAVGTDATLLVLTHSDWPPGSDGEAAYAYFAEAWPWVLDRFAASLQAKPQPAPPTGQP